MHIYVLHTNDSITVRTVHVIGQCTLKTSVLKSFLRSLSLENKIYDTCPGKVYIK